jgi:hypothetical protein
MPADQLGAKPNSMPAPTLALNQVGRGRISSQAVGRVRVADRSPPRRPHSLSAISGRPHICT